MISYFFFSGKLLGIGTIRLEIEDDLRSMCIHQTKIPKNKTVWEMRIKLNGYGPYVQRGKTPGVRKERERKQNKESKVDNGMTKGVWESTRSSINQTRQIRF